jgi:hypothetical protein
MDTIQEPSPNLNSCGCLTEKTSSQFALKAPHHLPKCLPPVPPTHLASVIWTLHRALLECSPKCSALGFYPCLCEFSLSLRPQAVFITAPTPGTLPCLP